MRSKPHDDTRGFRGPSQATRMVDCIERRKCILRGFNWLAVFWLSPPWGLRRSLARKPHAQREAVMKLPPPTWQGTVSVEQAIKQRRTTRSFASRALTLDQLSQLLGAASGITETNGFKRAAPSAGALYPMDLYVVAGQGGIPPIEAGVYRYQPAEHQLTGVASGDLRATAARASLSQMWMAEAPITLVITAAYTRVTIKYGKRGVRYALVEAGHIGQNIYLQAEAMGLAAGIVGAFHDAALISALQLPADHEPILLMPAGYPR